MSDLLLGTGTTFSRNPDDYVFDDGNDVQFDVTGKLIEVSDLDKLTQSLGKILLTDQGAGIDGAYGTVLNSYVGSELIEQPVYALIKQTIIDALGYYGILYEDSDNLAEKLNTFESMSLRVNIGTPTTLSIDLKISNENSELANIRLTI
jgi:hypothetical protein